MDEVARFNKARWEELVREGVGFSRPWLDLDPETARERVDREGMLGEVAGRDVLCLAGGGGQQSAAFGLLGARVTVLDLAEGQLARDREAARHHDLDVRTVQGDMRDLSGFPHDAFDVVWHAHALSFVPDAERVFDEVARVLRPGGLYRLYWTNPFVHGAWESPWTEHGYGIRQPYVDGGEVRFRHPAWSFEREDGSRAEVRGPREWRHALGPVVNGLIARGFRILGLWEDVGDDEVAEPGSWAHFKRIAPPWLTLWARR